MERRKIGSLEVSVVGLGCNNFGWYIDEAATREVVNAALDAGVNLLDTADAYDSGRSEMFIASALGSRRDEAVIATKFGSPMSDELKGARPEYVKFACDASLKRLGVEYIDLYQLHWPDPETPIADTLGAMNELVDAGKIREIGCSNLSVVQLRAARAAVGEGQRAFVSAQNEYSLLARDAETGVIPECAAEGMSFLPYYPLHNGLLSGKFRRGIDLPAGSRVAKMNDERREKLLNDRNMTIVEGLSAFAESKGHTLLELAFSRLIANPTVASVIAGATSAAQITANAAAAAWTLTDADIAAIDAITNAP